MTEPWFDPNWFGADFGGIGGSLCGVLGGTWGAMVGYLAPRGRGRRFVVTSTVVLIVLGASQLLFGAAALLCGQPYGIWYPPTLLGVIMCGVLGAGLPVVLRRYRQAERRRIEAEGLLSS